MRGKGEVSRFPGPRGKLLVLRSLIRADLEALRMLPKMLAKRRRIRPLRRLTSSEIVRLLWRNRISLRQLSEQSN
jgi:hypothetical protein